MLRILDLVSQAHLTVVSGVVTTVVVPLLLSYLVSVKGVYLIVRSKVLVESNQCLLAQTHRNLTRSLARF